MRTSRAMAATAVLAVLLTAACAARPAADGAAVYQELLDTLHGSAEARLAVEARANAAFQQAIADCMRKAGFSYTPAPPENLSGGPIVPSDLTSLAPFGIGEFGVADFKRHVAEAADLTTNPGYTTLRTDRERAAYDSALGPCVSAAPEVAPFSPTGQHELVMELDEIMTAAERQPAAAAKLAAYAVCMRRAGYAVENYLQLYQLVDAAFPDPTVGWAALSADPRWIAAVDVEHRAAAVDEVCRAELRDHVMAAARPVLTQFAVRHAGALAAASRQWAEQSAPPIT